MGLVEKNECHSQTVSHCMRCNDTVQQKRRTMQHSLPVGHGMRLHDIEKGNRTHKL